MSDYIDREQAIDAVKTYWKKVVDDIPKGTGFEEMTQSCDMALEHNANILKAIKQLPSAQRTGEWEEIGVIADAYDINGVKTWASKMKCDQCGFTTIAIEGHFSQYNFCPNCGADCRGGQDE